MAKNEDGEFEVMVGNKQLLSILFVLMVMFGIVFTMGYFVGRNSTAETASAPTPAQVSTEGRPEPAPAAAAAPAAADSTVPPDANPPAAPATQTVPVGGTPQPPVAAKPETPPAPSASGAVPSGTYLQVTAIKRPDAELFAEALKRKGLPAIVGDSVSRNGEELYRVLVGPYNDPASLARARSDIETLLKRQVFIRKY